MRAHQSTCAARLVVPGDVVLRRRRRRTRGMRYAALSCAACAVQDRCEAWRRSSGAGLSSASRLEGVADRELPSALPPLTSCCPCVLLRCGARNRRGDVAAGRGSEVGDRAAGGVRCGEHARDDAAVCSAAVNEDAGHLRVLRRDGEHERRFPEGVRTQRVRAGPQQQPRALPRVRRVPPGESNCCTRGVLPRTTVAPGGGKGRRWRTAPMSGVVSFALRLFGSAPHRTRRSTLATCPKILAPRSAV
ncbi:unnamed protein product [Pedinophyceae sp. YPF-701]|nr:unnamed protein product [Pedinophyceae sp. YPF-701]